MEPTFTNVELAAMAKASDIHRQSLIRRLSNINDQSVRAEMTEEIRACDSASAKLKREQRRRLDATAAAS